MASLQKDLKEFEVPDRKFINNNQSDHKITNPFLRKIISKVYYGLHPKDRMFVLDLFPENSVGAELGVFRGEFTGQILERVKPKMLYLIDLWEYDSEIHPANFDETPDMKKSYEQVKKKFGKRYNVSIRKGDSREELKLLPDSSLDWAYVDADHRYEGVKGDLDAVIGKVKKNGIIAGDDYVEKEGWGVIRAVNEMIDGKLVEPVLIKDYQYVLRKL